jgi:hypothetical protein
MKSSTAAQIAIKEHNAYMVARSIVEDSISQSGIHNHLTSSVSSILEKNADLTELLVAARDFIAGDENCGPAGLGLICMIDDQLRKDIK